MRAADLNNVAAATANKMVWSPAITGNVIVIGSAPTHLHVRRPSMRSLLDMIIRLAVDQPEGALRQTTGLYASLACYYFSRTEETTVDFLTGIGNFTSVIAPESYGCGAHVVQGWLVSV